MNSILNDLVGFLIYLPAIIISLTFHEYAHGYTAYSLGDDTARLQGRLTINPLPHLDPIGFIIMLFPPHFGWAKPVQVNPYRFKKMSPRSGMMVVSLAGPLMNVLLAAVSLIAIKYVTPFATGGNGQITFQLLKTLYQVNLVLAAFNIIPIPPLDGSRILAWVLPDSMNELMYTLERYGFMILLLLLLTGVFDRILGPVITALQTILWNIIM
ncbi:MAG: site-2 protease family protein [Methylocystaceae bacterium]